jgi:hypothetical protein
MRGAHANLAGFAGRDLLVVIVENFDIAGGSRETTGQEQFRGLRIVVGPLLCIGPSIVSMLRHAGNN